MFYRKGKKVINPKIENCVTPLCLAIWMSSIPLAYYKLQLNTDLRRKEDIDILIDILANRFDLTCYSFQYNKSYFGLGIAEESKDLFIAIIKPYLYIIEKSAARAKLCTDLSK